MNNTIQKLGIKVFFYYLLNKIIIGLLLFVFYLILLNSKAFFASKMISFLPVDKTTLVLNYFVFGVMIISLLFIFGALILSWLKYISCRFILGENAISIKRGILNIEEVSIPYRHIQNINIEQSLKYRMMGVSKLIILTAGNDDPSRADRSESVFDIIDSKIAIKIKEYILQKTNIQNTNETKI